MEIDPAQGTGWQGLVSFYEKQFSATNESDVEGRRRIASDLCDTYLKMLNLTKEADKFETLSEKLVDLTLSALKNLDAVVDLLVSRISFMESLDDPTRSRRAQSELIRILNTQQIGELTSEHDNVMKSCLTKVRASPKPKAFLQCSVCQVYLHCLAKPLRRQISGVFLTI